jgi:hypothetical protein
VSGNSCSSWSIAANSENPVIQNLTSIHPAITPTSIESVLYADQFPGADIGAEVNAANTACAAYATTGCEIVIPAGAYSFSTPITITTRALLVGQGGGTVLTYTGTGTAITLNIPSEATNLQDSNKGMQGIMLLGPSASGATVGVLIEGPSLGSSATGVQLNGVTIRGFGTGVEIGSNAYWTRLQDTSLEFNGVNFSFPSGTTNSGEQISFEHSFIADATVGANIYIDASGASIQITDTSVDCGSPALNVGIDAASAYIDISGSHFECHSLAQAISAAAGIISVVNSTFLQGASTGTLASLIAVSGTANIYVQQSGFQTLGATVTNIIANTNTGDVIYGANNTDIANFTNVLSAPTSASGTWFGSQLLGAAVVGGSGAGNGFKIGPTSSGQCIQAFGFGAAGPFICNPSVNDTEMMLGYGSNTWLEWDSTGITFPHTVTFAGGATVASGTTVNATGATWSGGTVNATTLEQGGNPAVTNGGTSLTSGTLTCGAGSVTVANCTSTNYTSAGLALASKLTGIGSGTYTTGTSDAVSITWADGGTRTPTACAFSPTNSTAAAATVIGYISAYGSNSVTINHVATSASGGTIAVLCSGN